MYINRCQVTMPGKPKQKNHPHQQKIKKKKAVSANETPVI